MKNTNLIIEINLNKINNIIENKIYKEMNISFIKLKKYRENKIIQIIEKKFEILKLIIENMIQKVKLNSYIKIKYNLFNENNLSEFKNILINKEIKKFKKKNFILENKIENNKKILNNFNSKMDIFVKNINFK